MEGASPFPRSRDAVRKWFAGHDVAENVPVHVFALGKAAPAMAAGALSALEGLRRGVEGGIVVSSHEPGTAELHGVSLPRNLVVCVGDHPVPGPASLHAADAIEDAVAQVSTGDVVLVLLSGGTTALCAAPIASLTQTVGDAGKAQAHLANLAQTLLESGLAIHEMNAIRRRVLRWGAGRLAVALQVHGAAYVATFAISDVVGDDPAVIGSGPCSPDPLDETTFLALLDAHDMRTRVERAIGTVLGLEGNAHPPAVPLASHSAFARVSYTIVARNADALRSMAQRAADYGLTTVVVDAAPLEGDAALLGDALARRALAVARTLPRGGQALLLCGGEPVVHLRDTVERAMQRTDDADAFIEDEPLRGGRMQVLALAAALVLEEAAMSGDETVPAVTVLAAGTDGRDGPTDAAGAIVDAAVPALARRARRTPETDLETGRSWYPLDGAGALLRTGPTGTNVMDVVAVLIER